MKLRFFAHDASMVRELGVNRYYGRDPSPPFAVNKDGCEFEAGTPDADKCAKACRKGDLIAANAETAAAVGAEFIKAAPATSKQAQSPKDPS
jgi:hypothetical protein